MAVKQSSPATRVAAVGIIGHVAGRTVTTVRTADGITGTVTPARSLSAATLKLRTAARAACYNPDDSVALDALACTAGVTTARLADVFAGRAPLDRLTSIRVARVLGINAPAADTATLASKLPAESRARRRVLAVRGW